MHELAEFPATDGMVFPDAIEDPSKPTVFRGLVSHWPLVAAAERSREDADSYLRLFYADTPITVSVVDAAADGRIFYNDDFSGFNFRTTHDRLDRLLDRLRQLHDDEQPETHYMGSTAVDRILPGLRAENDLDFGIADPSVRIWIGNRTRIAAHYDIPANIACVVAGRRRFTLFPPDQLGNLYVGPLDRTPAGQSISLVDFRNPDLDRFPKFARALEHALVADLQPGDAIYIPGMWWHHVEGLETFNVLVNYWWRDVPARLGTPLDALNHALLSIRDLPAEQRAIWRELFEYYVFGDAAENTAHIPPRAKGVHAPLDDATARQLRARLIRNLNR